MATEIRVPTLGESVTEATIGQWFKKVGDAVAADEPLVELETDKVTVEVPAPAAGKLTEITAKEGETVELNALLGMIAEGQGGSGSQGRGAESRRHAEAGAVGLPDGFQGHGRRAQRRHAGCPVGGQADGREGA